MNVFKIKNNDNDHISKRVGNIMPYLSVPYTERTFVFVLQPNRKSIYN